MQLQDIGYGHNSVSNILHLPDTMLDRSRSTSKAFHCLNYYIMLEKLNTHRGANCKQLDTVFWKGKRLMLK